MSSGEVAQQISNSNIASSGSLHSSHEDRRHENPISNSGIALQFDASGRQEAVTMEIDRQGHPTNVHSTSGRQRNTRRRESRSNGTPPSDGQSQLERMYKNSNLNAAAASGIREREGVGSQREPAAARINSPALRDNLHSNLAAGFNNQPGRVVSAEEDNNALAASNVNPVSNASPDVNLNPNMQPQAAQGEIQMSPDMLRNIIEENLPAHRARRPVRRDNDETESTRNDNITAQPPRRRNVRAPGLRDMIAGLNAELFANLGQRRNPPQAAAGDIFGPNLLRNMLGAESPRSHRGAGQALQMLMGIGEPIRRDRLEQPSPTPAVLPLRVARSPNELVEIQLERQDERDRRQIRGEILSPVVRDERERRDGGDAGHGERGGRSSRQGSRDGRGQERQQHQRRGLSLPRFAMRARGREQPDEPARPRGIHVHIQGPDDGPFRPPRPGFHVLHVGRGPILPRRRAPVVPPEIGVLPHDRPQSIHGSFAMQAARQSMVPDECPVCWDKRVNCFISPCDHKICYDCVARLVGERKNCPMCRGVVEKVSELPVLK